LRRSHSPCAAKSANKKQNIEIAAGARSYYIGGMSSLAEVFSPTGALSEGLPDFTYREAQQRMAGLVWEAITREQHAALEAGTGIGKTYAYVVPVMLSGRRAIISTGTRTLQDQLFTRDLPALGAALGRPVEVALLKGRNNYLCWHRLETARLDGRQDAQTRATLQTLADWGHASRSGDLTELDDLAEEHALRGVVTSTVDNCLGSQCEHLENCFVLRARRRAQAADIVIVNHHLLLADLALKEAGFGELLPGADAVIVDEAHQLPDIAQQFFGVSVTSRELELLFRDITAEGRAARAGDALERVVNDAGKQLADIRIGARTLAGRVPWASSSPLVRDGLRELGRTLRELAEILAAFADRQGLARCRERCGEAAARLETIASADDEDGLRWLEFAPAAFGAHWTPLDIGAALAQRIDAQAGTWVFTSATLAVGDDFQHFLARVGVRAPITDVLPSPFDYANNARLYVPQGLPEPRDAEHVPALMENVWPLLDAAGGGAFLLFTSYRALRTAQQWLAVRSAPGPVLVQGEGPRSQLLDTFRAAGNAILLGTGSFWQGVDVRGPALRIVVIDKLPFAAPDDPLVQARVAAIRRAGGDPFVEFQLPQAVLALKQGVGRLIRDFGDRGLIVLGDPRLRTRSYGRLFLASLPPMPQLQAAADVLEYAAGLAGPIVADEGRLFR
jgi:ATP-dependent DNA helicase DinG